jgi:hypothetical protein
VPTFPVVLAPGSSLSDYYPRYVRTGEVNHAGLVLKVASHVVRVMSDVDAEEYYALVWDPAAKVPTSVNLHTAGFGASNEAEVDATPEVRAAYAAYLEERARAQEAADYKRRCEEARRRLLEPRVGFLARVVKGHKVPIGTEGFVTWEGPSVGGLRVGIRDAAGNVRFTAASNVERVVSLLDGEDWCQAERRLRPAYVEQWDAVRITGGPDEGVAGTAFYVKDGKVGVATTNRKVGGRYADVVWTFASIVEVTEARDGQEPPFVTDDQPRPPVVVPF